MASSGTELHRRTLSLRKEEKKKRREVGKKGREGKEGRERKRKEAVDRSGWEAGGREKLDIYLTGSRLEPLSPLSPGPIGVRLRDI